MEPLHTMIPEPQARREGLPLEISRRRNHLALPLLLLGMPTSREWFVLPSQGWGGHGVQYPPFPERGWVCSSELRYTPHKDMMKDFLGYRL